MYKGVLIGHPLQATCTKFITRHKPLSHADWLERMKQVPEFDATADFYGRGPTVDILEHRMADMLGKERALFVHKGMIGQHSALLSYAHRSGHSTIAIHPQSHMQVDEDLAYKDLLCLDAVMFGKAGAAIDREDICALPADLATAVVELPVRRAGFRLPEWEDLEALKAFSDQTGVPIHFDGARLFEASQYWGKSYSDVAAMSNSVYVSLYKTLGAAAGGIIAGDADLMESLIPWCTRLGGDIFTVFPYILTALWGLEHYLPRIPEFHDRALSLSKHLQQAFGAQAIPKPVQCSGFLIELPVAPDILEAKALKLAQDEKIWLFDRIYDAGPNTSQFEIQVGDALDDWTDEELSNCLTGLLS